MDGDVHIPELLERLQVTCPACGVDNPSRNTVCSTCGEEIPDDDVWSVSATAVEAGLTPSVPLERTKNYRLLQEAAAGAVLGTMSDDMYRESLIKLMTVGDNGLRACDMEAFQKKFEDVEPEMKQLAVDLRRAFSMVLNGVQRMEKFLKTRNHDDVREGYASAKAGFALMVEVGAMAHHIG